MKIKNDILLAIRYIMENHNIFKQPNESNEVKEDAIINLLEEI